MNAPGSLRRLTFAAALAGLLGGPALARQAAVANPALTAPDLPRAGYPPLLTPVQAQAQALRALPGYLPSDGVPDSFRILPPAPSGDSPARRADIAAYRETRGLRGGERWDLAASDAVLTPFSILDDESCALGVRLDRTNAPHLIDLLTRTERDASHIVNKAKDQFRQVRPFVALGGPICTEADRDGVAKSYSYPSGHATYSWAVGLILAELAPDRATPILARARAYGESRVVCGVHWVSDVEEGRTNASVLLAVLHAQPQFEADLAGARREVDAARAESATRPQAGAPAGPVRCALDASGHTPWTR